VMAGRLRVANRQASLEELGQLADPPLTKDAIAGRIRRLLAMADRRATDLGLPSTEAFLTLDMLSLSAGQVRGSGRFRAQAGSGLRQVQGSGMQEPARWGWRVRCVS
jgi:hypothetical protein